MWMFFEVSLISCNNCFVIRAKKLAEKLSVYKLGSDSNFLERLRKNLFSSYLSSYTRWVCKYCKAVNVTFITFA